MYKDKIAGKMYVYLKLRAVTFTSLKHNYSENQIKTLWNYYTIQKHTYYFHFMQLIQVHEYHIAKFTLPNGLH